ncbi:MAG TPA: phage holin family protein [Verrucomicrobiae bacterium]|nr:phage holin family protein [Verrucomicrobiae bacterium]
MAHDNPDAPGLTALAGRLARTGLSAVENRLELLVVEFQEERIRITELLLWAFSLMFAGLLAALLFTATIILLFRPGLRLYVAAGFTVLYLLAALLAWLGLRSALKHEPFSATLEQARKDREWIESLK